MWGVNADVADAHLLVGLETQITEVSQHANQMANRMDGNRDREGGVNKGVLGSVRRKIEAFLQRDCAFNSMCGTSHENVPIAALQSHSGLTKSQTGGTSCRIYARDSIHIKQE